MADSTARAIWGKAGIYSNKKDKWYKGTYSESRAVSGACDMFNVVTWSPHSQNVSSYCCCCLLLFVLSVPWEGSWPLCVSLTQGGFGCSDPPNMSWTAEIFPCSSVWLSPCCCPLAWTCSSPLQLLCLGCSHINPSVLPRWESVTLGAHSFGLMLTMSSHYFLFMAT